MEEIVRECAGVPLALAVIGREAWTFNPKDQATNACAHREVKKMEKT